MKSKSRRIHFLLTRIGDGISPSDLLPFSETIFFNREYAISTLRFLFKKGFLYYDSDSKLFKFSLPSTKTGGEEVWKMVYKLIVWLSDKILDAIAYFRTQTFCYEFRIGSTRLSGSYKCSFIDRLMNLSLIHI